MSSAALFTKPSYADADKVGDCPFTHFVLMAFHIAGKSATPVPTKRDNKPQWLMDQHNGSMPCLAPNGVADGTDSVSDSMQIATQALPPTPVDDASLAAAQGFFPSIAKLIKNKDAPGEGGDAELREGLTAALTKLDAHLKATGSSYFSGAAPGFADASIATKLFVISVACAHYKAYTLDAAALPTLAAYQERIFAHPAFAETKYDPADAITGWGEARG